MKDSKQLQLDTLDQITAALTAARDEALNFTTTRDREYVVFFNDDFCPFRERAGEVALVGDRIYTANQRDAEYMARGLQAKVDASPELQSPRRAIGFSTASLWGAKRAEVLTGLINEWNARRDVIAKEGE